jgi:hypothetical protein
VLPLGPEDPFVHGRKVSRILPFVSLHLVPWD